MTSEVEFIRRVMPSIEAILAQLQTQIDPEMRASDDPDDNQPGMQVTFACDDELNEWTFQTGDNSFSGPCYHLPNWAVVYLYQDSEATELAKDAIEQLLDTRRAAYSI